MYHLTRMTLLIIMAAGIMACSEKSPQSEATTDTPESKTMNSTIPESSQPESVDGELGGTSWQLVQIMSMDDSTEVPADPSLYTLSFGADGTINIRVDCNRGTGSWTSDSTNSLQFGPIAATRALCPPESLHDVYLAQFEWVRSYVIRDDHLFLSTMADGSIIEFEPVLVD